MHSPHLHACDDVLTHTCVHPKKSNNTTFDLDIDIFTMCLSQKVFPKYGKLLLQGEDATTANQDALASRTQTAQISVENLLGVRSLPDPLPEGYPVLEPKPVCINVCACMYICKYTYGTTA
jgi:hypothetical protein